MGDVVKFEARAEAEVKQAEPEHFTWQCECGSFTFVLYSDNSVACSECEAAMSNLRLVQESLVGD